MVDIAKEYALSMIDTTVAAPELMPEEWDAIIAEVEANLAYNDRRPTDAARLRRHEPFRWEGNHSGSPMGKNPQGVAGNP